MNEVKIESNGEDLWNVTLPNGESSIAIPTNEVVKRLKYAEQQFKAALDDIKASWENFQKDHPAH